jgi:hypothetical protein
LGTEKADRRGGFVWMYTAGPQARQQVIGRRSDQLASLASLKNGPAAFPWRTPVIPTRVVETLKRNVDGRQTLMPASSA